MYDIHRPLSVTARFSVTSSIMSSKIPPPRCHVSVPRGTFIISCFIYCFTTGVALEFSHPDTCTAILQGISRCDFWYVDQGRKLCRMIRFSVDGFDPRGTITESCIQYVSLYPVCSIPRIPSSRTLCVLSHVPCILYFVICPVSCVLRSCILHPVPGTRMDA